MNKKKVLIVGGSSGLGFHLTNLYIKNKYKLTTISRNINPKINKSVKQISCDVTNLEQAQKILKNFKKGKISFDIIIHNVGGSQKIFD